MKKEYRRVAGGSITGGIILIVIALVAYGAFAIYFALGKEKDPVVPYIILCGVAPAISLALIAAGIFTIVEALRKKKILAKGTKKRCQIIDLFALPIKVNRAVFTKSTTLFQKNNIILLLKAMFLIALSIKKIVTLMKTMSMLLIDSYENQSLFDMLLFKER